MSTTFTFPSGGSFTIIDPEDISERKRRPVSDMLITIMGNVEDESDLPDPDAAADTEPTDKLDLAMVNQLDALNDLVAVSLLESWTLDAPITVDAVLDLSKRDYKALREAVAPLAFSMLPDFSPTPEEDTPTSP